MSSQHQLAIIALRNLLRDAAGLADSGQVHIGRARAISAAVRKAIVVRMERAASQQAATLSGRASWTTLISIECYGRDEEGAEPGTAVDELIEQVFALLDSAPTLCAGFGDIEPLAGDTLSWDYDELDKTMACVTARFVMKHQTTGRTLTI